MLRPKVLGGVKVNGYVFLNLVQNYMNAFNQNVLPEIKTCLD